MTFKPNQHLPATMQEVRALGWDAPDIVLITGDANVDHPTFPANLLGRILQAQGYRVGILARPNLENPDSVAALGKPKLFFGVTAGALDSLVANYTALKRIRSDDPYAPGGRGGGRPDRALTVYCNLVRRKFGKKVFVVGGGLEAGLRTFAHYDFWSDSVRRPILMDCGADVILRGLGERMVVNLAHRVKEYFQGLEQDPREQDRPLDIKDMVAAVSDLHGIVYRTAKSADPPEGVELPSAEDVKNDSKAHANAFKVFEKTKEKVLFQNTGGMRVIANPLGSPLTGDELDEIFELPFSRDVHPVHKGARVPALEQVRFSITTHRGCFGGCAFCAITAHQGKTVMSRSEKSILKEVETITSHPRFKGTLHDIGGPSANMYGSACTKEGGCDRPSCLWPKPCKHLSSQQGRYGGLLHKIQRLPGIKHVFVTTGLRADLAMMEKPFVKQIARDHTSGHLKLAPEHVCPEVLAKMRKPELDSFLDFVKVFNVESEKARKNQFVLPYLMAAHPGSDVQAMVKVYRFLKDNNLRVEQCQIFTPTPGTASTVMYATGLDPATGEPVYVERDPKAKAMQKALITYHLRESQPLVNRALQFAKDGRPGSTELPPPPKKIAPARKSKRRIIR